FLAVVTSNDYLIGAEALFGSIRATGSSRKRVLMVTPQCAALQRHGLLDEIVAVEPIAIPAAAEVPQHVRAWAEVGYTKLRIWSLIQYRKVVYVDADALVDENVDELFDLPTDFAAAPDIHPPDRFNAGVMVLTPSEAVLEEMLGRTATTATYDGGDTAGFLNAFFPDWFSGPAAGRLPFRYNAQRTMYWNTHERNPEYWKAVQP
ncbi:unnamed protein product, partial [Phaeothamnion confervicola]